MMFGLPWPYFLVAVVVGIGSAARLTRLVVSDHWPPVMWFKRHWDRWLAGNDWWLLAACPWCLGPWMMLVVGGWAVLDVMIDGRIDWPWWVVNGWLAASYVVSWVVFHDEDAIGGGGPPEDEEG